MKLLKIEWKERKSVPIGDRNPLYWTISKEGIFMRDSYEFKRKSIKMYRNGIHPDTLDGVSKELV